MAELRDLRLSARLSLPARHLSVRFSRSGGPGGQHVNKVESKVDLRLDLLACAELLGEDRLQRIRQRLGNRLDGEGQLQVVVSEHRQQAMNLDTALRRMEELLQQALQPTRKRRATRPTRGSQQRRLTQKKQRGEIKKMRRDRNFGD